jgi:hypothetical protein
MGTDSDQVQAAKITAKGKMWAAAIGGSFLFILFILNLICMSDQENVSDLKTDLTNETDTMTKTYDTVTPSENILHSQSSDLTKLRKMFDVILATPPLHRQSIANSYKGVKLVLKGAVSRLKKVEDSDSISIQIMLTDYKSYDTPYLSTHCRVDPNNYPGIEALKENDSIMIEGEIESLNADKLLSDVEFSKFKISFN